MIIRDVTIDDIPCLAKIYYQFWNTPSDVEKMRNKFVQIQQNSAYILLCAVLNKQVVGTVMGIVCEELYGDCLPFILVENMIVDSAARRIGVGRSLFSELENRARQMGCRQILLVTETDRDDARAFYEALGFHPTANKGYKKSL